MKNIFQSLLLVIAGATQKELARQVERHLLCAADGLSVECVAAAVRFVEHRASLLSGMGTTRRVGKILDGLLATI
jgi:hypothetical protein